MNKLALLLLATSAFAALPTTTVYEIRQDATAANVNGGGFNPANASFFTDWTATSATGNSPVVASASVTFVSGDATDTWVWSIAGTGWDVYRSCKIASVDTSGGTSATLDAAIGHCIDYTPTDRNKGVPSTTAGIGSTGSPTGGTLGLDFSQRASAKVAYTDLVIGATTTQVTSSTSPFSGKYIGNLIQIVSGTNCTQGWSEVVSVSSVTATLTNSGGTAAASCNANLGGAISLGSATANRTDDIFFELATASATAANRIYVRYSATAFSNAVVTLAAAGNVLQPIVIEGYQTYRGDRPRTKATQPTFNMGSVTFTLGTAWDVRNISWIGSAANVLATGSGNKVISCYFVNNSTTANRQAIGTGSNNYIRDNDIVAYRGYGVNLNSSTVTMIDNYIHASNIGVLQAVAGNAIGTYIHNIFAGNVTHALQYSAGSTALQNIEGNTFYGWGASHIGNGINIATGASAIRIANNTFSGLSTGVNWTDVESGVFTLNNNWYDNGTDVTNMPRGDGALAVDPAFTSVSIVSNSGTVTAGASDLIVTDTTQNFTTAGVVAGRDYFYLVSGTNCTAGIYGIATVGTTTITLDLDPTSSSTGSSIVYHIITGGNFAVGTALKNAGFPGVFAGGLTTAYTPVGAVSPQVSSSGGQKGHPIQ